MIERGLIVPDLPVVTHKAADGPAGQKYFFLIE